MPSEPLSLAATSEAMSIPRLSPNNQHRVELRAARAFSDEDYIEIITAQCGDLCGRGQVRWHNACMRAVGCKS